MKKIITILSFSLIASLSVVGQQRKIDSLYNEIKKWENITSYQADTSLFEIYFNLAKKLQNSDVDTSIYFFKQSIAKAKILKDVYKEANALNLLGWSFYVKGDYNSALDNYNTALLLLIEKTKSADHDDLKIKKIRASIDGNIGALYHRQSNYTLALEYYFKSLKIHEEINDKKNQITNLLNIGSVYQEYFDYTKALEYCSKAMRLSNEIGNKQQQSISLLNMGTLYFNLGNYATAFENYSSSLKIFEELNDKKGQSIIYINIGLLLKNVGDSASKAGNNNLMMDKYSQSLQSYLKALKFNQELGDKFSLAVNLGHIGNLYIKLKKYHDAEEYLKNAIKLGEQLHNLYNLNIFYSYLVDLYKETGRYKEASETYEKLTAYKDSLYNEENQKVAIKKDIQYDFEKKQALAQAEFDKQQALTKLEIDRKEILLEKNRQSLLLLEQQNKLKTLTLMRKQAQLKQKQAEAENQQKTIALLNKEREVKLIEAREKEQAIKRQKIIIYGVSFGILLVLVLLGVSIYGYHQKQKSNKIILQQKLLVEQQKAELEKQNQIVEEKNKEITDSINYSKRIQQAILPDEDTWKKLLPESFVIYLPKDIVAGDFYWLEETDEYIFVASADCTGHGVPGAMVSVICSNALTRTVIEEKIYETNLILDRTREIITEKLSSTRENIRDGMDVCLIRINKKNKKQIQYSGANRPLWITRNKELSEYKADKQSISYHEELKPYTAHALTLQVNDALFLTTDGYADQFGGERQKKIGTKTFKELICTYSENNLQQTGAMLKDYFYKWKKDYEQVDDVTLIGLKV